VAVISSAAPIAFFVPEKPKPSKDPDLSPLQSAMIDPLWRSGQRIGLFQDGYTTSILLALTPVDALVVTPVARMTGKFPRLPTPPKPPSVDFEPTNVPPADWLTSQIVERLRAQVPMPPSADGWLATNFISHASAKAAGADTALEVEILSLGLKKLSHGWALHATVYARFVRLSDEQMLGSLTVQHETPSARRHSLAEWQLDGSALLLKELEEFVRATGDDLASQLHRAR
jgi:hypothetical protein